MEPNESVAFKEDRISLQTSNFIGVIKADEKIGEFLVEFKLSNFEGCTKCGENNLRKVNKTPKSYSKCNEKSLSRVELQTINQEFIESNSDF